MLRYEKFDPPPVASLSSTEIDKSPEMEKLPDFNTDLMSEMHDIIYRKTSPFPTNQPTSQFEPPQVNRQVSHCLFYC